VSADRGEGVAANVADAAEDVGSSRPLGWAARLGLTARAVVYLVIGLLGLSLASGNRAELDQKGALRELLERPFGFVLVLLCAVGFAGYAVWRFTEAVSGPVGDGDSTSARLKSFARGVIYSVLAFTAVAVLLGSRSSQGGEQRGLVATVLTWPGGTVIVLVAGLAVAAAGAGLVIEGWRRKFLKYLDHTDMNDGTRRLARWTGTVGSVARGLVVVLIGVLLVVAAATGDKEDATGMDGALKSLLELPFGRVLLILASLGLLVFGVYALVEARYRRVGVSGDGA
jgi:Domain of Unknown Function (DUF1206)